MAIYLDRAGVEECISAINGAIGTLEEAAGSIDKTMTGQLGGSWQGNAYEKTMSTYTEGYQKMLTKDIPDMVAQLREFVDGATKAIVEVDQQLAGS